jgi:WD40 repeat protein
MPAANEGKKPSDGGGPANLSSGAVTPSFKYWAFISYSHQDRKWGDWLHHALETYRIPKRLIGASSREENIPSRLFPIFRDREELPTSANLGENIHRALNESRFLVVICSPHAAQSHWVNEEILTFKRLGRGDRILPLIISGEPNASDGKPGVAPDLECFPQGLRFKTNHLGELTDERTEPIAADARAQADGRANAKLKLIAGILGVDYDSLRQRELARKARRLQLFGAAALGLIAIFASISVFAWRQKSKAEVKELEANTQKAEANAQRERVLAQQIDLLISTAADHLRNGRRRPGLLLLAEVLKLDPSHKQARLSLLTHLAYEKMAPAKERFPAPPGDSRIVFSKDGKSAFLWTGSTGKVIDVATRTQVGTDLEHDLPIDRAHFLQNGATLLTKSSGTPGGEFVNREDIVYWDLATTPAKPRRTVAMGELGLDEANQRAVYITGYWGKPGEAFEFPLLEIKEEGGKPLPEWSKWSEDSDSVELDPTGRWIVLTHTPNNDTEVGKKVSLLKYASRKPVHDLTPAKCTAFSQDGSKLAMITPRELVILALGEKIVVTRTDLSQSALEGRFESVMFTPDARTVATEDKNGHRVYVWTLEEEGKITELENIDVPGREWRVSNDRCLYAWSNAGLLYEADLTSPDPAGLELLYDGGEISSVAALPDAPGVAVLWKEGLAAFFRRAAHQGAARVIAGRDRHFSAHMSAVFSHGGDRFALWDAKNDVWTLRDARSGEFLAGSGNVGWQRGVQNLLLSRDGNWALTTDSPGEGISSSEANKSHAKLWHYGADTSSLTALPLPGTADADYTNDWSFSADGTKLLLVSSIISEDKKDFAKSFTLPSLSPLLDVIYHDQEGRDVPIVFNQSGTACLLMRSSESGEDDSEILEFHSSAGKVEWNRAFRGAAIRHVTFIGDNFVILDAHQEKLDRLIVMAAGTGQQIGSATIHEEIKTLSTSPDKSYLAAASDRSAYVYKLPECNLIFRLDRPVSPSGIRQPIFLDGARIFAIPSHLNVRNNPALVELFDSETFLPLGNVAHSEGLEAISPKANGDFLGAVSNSGELLRFDLPPPGEDLLTENFNSLLRAWLGLEMREGKPRDVLTTDEAWNDLLRRIEAEPPSIYKSVALWLNGPNSSRRPNPFGEDADP